MLIPEVPKPPETKTVKVEIEVALLDELQHYQALVGGPNASYVVNGALRYLFDHDKDFIKAKAGTKSGAKVGAAIGPKVGPSAVVVAAIPGKVRAGEEVTNAVGQ